MFRPVYTRNDVGGGDHLPRQAPSSSGLGLRPFTPATRVRVPSGSLNKSALGRNRLQSATKPVCGQAWRFALASRCGRERAPAAPLASWRRGNGRRPLLVRGHNRHGRQAHSTGLRADEHVGQLCRRADSGSRGQVLRGHQQLNSDPLTAREYLFGKIRSDPGRFSLRELWRECRP